MGTVDDYLVGLPAGQREGFARVVELAMAQAPEAEQGTSYGMAALIYRRKPLLGFRAASGHLSIFPFSPAAITAVADALDGFALSKGTVRFTAEQPLPEDAVITLVRHRMSEIDGPS
jgi:uncharacterized protein YdhG (YjbR/CyaY superfamily)